MSAAATHLLLRQSTMSDKHGSMKHLMIQSTASAQPSNYDEADDKGNESDSALPSPGSTSADTKAVKTLGPLTMEVQRFKLNTVKAIDDVNRNFTAEIFLELKIENGHDYSDLLDEKWEAGQPPHIVDGRPVFPFQWYLGQISYANALETNVLETKVMKHQGDKKNDIVLVHRADVVLAEDLELHQFPFDKQGLSCELVLLCDKDGPFACNFKMPDREGFLAIDRFLVSAFTLEERTGMTAVTNWLTSPTFPPKNYPRMIVTCYVSRRPSYFVYNVVYPMFALVTLAASSIMMPREEYNDRIILPLNVLLTAVAYKFSINSMLPEVPYLTLLDQLVLMSGLFMILLVISFVYNGIHGSDAEDRFITISLVVCYLTAVGRLAIHVMQARSSDIKTATLDRITKTLDHGAPYEKLEA